MEIPLPDTNEGQTEEEDDLEQARWNAFVERGYEERKIPLNQTPRYKRRSEKYKDEQPFQEDLTFNE